MAKKKSSIEATIVEFFTTAEPSAKQTLFNVIQGLMKSAQAPAAVAPAKATRTRSTKTSTTAAPATDAVAEQEAA